MLKKILPILLVPLLFAGCSTTFSNLSPREQARNENNLYPVEVRFDTRQRTIRWDSIQPTVLVDSQSYPMTPVPLVHNRWECLLPVPADKNSVLYCYKFDFLVNEFGGPQPNTAISPGYVLHISDK
jgi:hypothetical protein